eukprot:SAG31_NODE_236_length_19594_cov_7.018620_13_plen_165_part_00
MNCLKLVRGFAVWCIGHEVGVECVCGSYGVWRCAVLARQCRGLAKLTVKVSLLANLAISRRVGPPVHRSMAQGHGLALSTKRMSPHEALCGSLHCLEPSSWYPLGPRPSAVLLLYRVSLSLSSSCVVVRAPWFVYCYSRSNVQSVSLSLFLCCRSSRRRYPWCC